MAIEAYKIGISLIVDTNSTTALRGVHSQFEAIQKIVASIQQGMRGMVTDFRTLRDTGMPAQRAQNRTGPPPESATARSPWRCH